MLAMFANHHARRNQLGWVIPFFGVSSRFFLQKAGQAKAGKHNQKNSTHDQQDAGDIDPSWAFHDYIHPVSWINPVDRAGVKRGSIGGQDIPSPDSIADCLYSSDSVLRFKGDGDDLLSILFLYNKRPGLLKNFSSQGIQPHSAGGDNIHGAPGSSPAVITFPTGLHPLAVQAGDGLIQGLLNGTLVERNILGKKAHQDFHRPFFVSLKLYGGIQ